MSQERIKVLEMLAAGTIDVEQANRLFESLGEGNSRQHVQAAADSHGEQRGQVAKERKFGEFTFDQIIQMGTVGVTPDYIARVRQAGLSDLSFEQIIHMGTVGIEPEFIVRVREAGLTDLSFDEIVRMGTVGVEPEFVKQFMA